MMSWNQIWFPSPVTTAMSQLIILHDHAMMLLTGVLVVVSYSLLMSTNLNKFTNQQLEKSENAETVWSLLPIVLLISIAIPSLYVVYSIDDPTQEGPEVTIKVVGHQWYWSYEYTKWNSALYAPTLTPKTLSFCSFQTPLELMTQPAPRLLTVDNPVVMPMDTQLRLMFSSTDVIHSWTIFGSGIKMDCIEGAENSVYTKFQRPGIFYGACSELCGALHYGMPIQAEVIPRLEFSKWFATTFEKNAD